MRAILVWEGEDGRWYAQCPSLPGCDADADTYDDVMRAIKATAAAWIREARSAGQAVPPDFFMRLEFIHVEGD